MQLRAEVKLRSNDERLTLLAEMEFKIKIPALTGLALKADLCLPWSKMRRYYVVQAYFAILVDGWLKQVSKWPVRRSKECCPSS